MHLLVWQLNVLPDRASSFQPAVNTPALVGPAETESSAARKTRRCCVRLFVHQTLLMSLTRSKPQLCLFFGGESLSGSLPVVLIGVVEGFAEELLSVVYTIAQTRGHDQTSDKHRLLVFRIQDRLRKPRYARQAFFWFNSGYCSLLFQWDCCISTSYSMDVLLKLDFLDHISYTGTCCYDWY